MRQGRIFFQSRYYVDSGQVAIKDESFIKWGKCVLSAIKKTLHRDSVRSIYIGSDTLRWVEQDGGKLLKVGE